MQIPSLPKLRAKTDKYHEGGKLDFVHAQKASTMPYYQSFLLKRCKLRRVLPRMTDTQA